MIEEKRALTTGEVAKYCGVNFRTVIRWIERGQLKAYQLPGRGDNRVEVQAFLNFLVENGMPVPVEFQKQSQRVLIVEDDLSMAKSIQRVLKRNGFETAIAPDGFKAGSMINTFNPAVVTLDLKMPGLSGYDVLKFIRSDDRFRHIKVLIVSAMPSKEIERAMTAGADDMLSKPFKNEVLVEKVSRLMGGKLSSMTEGKNYAAR